MIKISNLLYSNPENFCDEANEAALKYAYLAEKIRSIVLNSESNIKHEIKHLDDERLIKLLITCLGYTKIEPSELGRESLRTRLRANIQECSRLLDIPASAIQPIASIEHSVESTFSEE